MTALSASLTASKSLISSSDKLSGRTKFNFIVFISSPSGNSLPVIITFRQKSRNEKKRNKIPLPKKNHYQNPEFFCKVK